MRRVSHRRHPTPAGPLRARDRLERRKLIARSGAGGLRKAIETGRLAVLYGSLEAELIGEMLRVRDDQHTLTIPDPRTAWQARTDRWPVLGAESPDLHADHTRFVALPLHGPVATAILAGAPQPDAGPA